MIARITMKDLAKKLKAGYRDYNTNLEFVSPDIIHVVGIISLLRCLLYTHIRDSSYNSSSQVYTVIDR